VIKRFIAMGFVAAALILGANINSAQAAVSGPAGASAIVDTVSPLTAVRWVCTPYRCVWRPGVRARVYPWAVWGAPPRPGCYYVRRRSGRWVIRC
jgi:hypothetical protein